MILNPIRLARIWHFKHTLDRNIAKRREARSHGLIYRRASLCRKAGA